MTENRAKAMGQKRKPSIRRNPEGKAIEIIALTVKLAKMLLKGMAG
jgi:hypothetical protein